MKERVIKDPFNCTSFCMSQIIGIGIISFFVGHPVVKMLMYLDLLGELLNENEYNEVISLCYKPNIFPE